MTEILQSSVDYFFAFLKLVIFVRILLSWLPVNLTNNPIVGLVYSITDPILLPIRNMLQNSPLGGRGMMLDFSPIFALFLLDLLRVIVQKILGAFL